MENFIEVSKPLNLQGAFNVRDLGGYLNRNNIKTKKNMFLRSDGLHNLTKNDCKILEEYGVGVVVDLRSDIEIKKEPSKMKDYENVKYINIPLIDNVQSNLLQGEFPNSLQELYIGLLDGSKELIKKVFMEMLKYRDKCILFNCSAGKDRTGVITMLLLNLAYVDNNVIIEDYSVSEENMKIVFEKQNEMVRALGIEMPDFLLKSEKEYMKATLKYFIDKYGSSKNYLKEIGLTIEEIEIIQCKLIKGE